MLRLPSSVRRRSAAKMHLYSVHAACACASMCAQLPETAGCPTWLDRCAVAVCLLAWAAVLCTSAAGRPAVQLLHHRAPCPRHCCRRR